jgi:hypothetical protein
MVLLDPEPHVRLGVPIATEESDLVIFPAAAVKLLNNVGCAIRTGSVVRSDPTIDDATRLFATGDQQIGWRPTAQVTGESFNGSSAWYAGWLQVPGKGTALVFVHSARCTPLEPVAAAVSDSEKTAILSNLHQVVDEAAAAKAKVEAL